MLTYFLAIILHGNFEGPHYCLSPCWWCCWQWACVCQFFLQVEDQVWVSFWLRHCRNTRELQLLSKHPHCIRRREEDARAILDFSLYLPPDKHVHLRVARQGDGAPWRCLSIAPGETLCGWCGRGCPPLRKTLGVPHLDT